MDLARPLAVITPTVDGDVLAVLAGAKASFTGRQVHRLLGRRSERGVRDALTRLTDQGIVARRRVGSSDLFTLNRAHLAAPCIEALAEMRDTFLRKVSAELQVWPVPPEYAALFGSAATGQMHPDSDIDLFVVRPDATDADESIWRTQVDELADHVSAWTGNDARVLELAAAEVAHGVRTGLSVLIDIMEQGLTLVGSTAYLSAVRSEGRVGP
jgi:predicted nucleotidyltransferase